MSECPYKNFKSKISKYIKLLREPREEYGGFPPCPFVGKEVDLDKLMIEVFDPSKNTLIDMIKKLIESKYDSGLFVQILSEEMTDIDTREYERFINITLKSNGHSNLKCICFNPNDTVNIDGFNIREKSPYFLINIAEGLVLQKAHRSLLKTKYYDKMDENYLNYLNIKQKNKEEK